ncbi:MAG: mandelate racemase/muconate lactonizing enzyme family protein [Chloroflexi bacterium]|nr:mandelate racemase/muconate lactonizing enzyme family protein [Chloroflexota bacterium]
MKITSVEMEVYRWPRRTPITNGLYTYTHSGLNVITVETDEGVTGTGISSGIEDAPEVGKAILDYLKQVVIGRDPLDNERHWYEMWRPKLVGRRGITTRVLGGLDIALWDLKGKIAGMPLYKLLGGFTDNVPAYIAGGYYEEGKGLKELADEMEANLEVGARAMKMKVGALPINEDVERVRVAREAIGPDIKLMVDANNAYRHYEAIQFARKIEKYDVFWFEEPVEPDDYIGQREITRATSVPIAAGENEYTRYGFRDLINHRAVDILQPDALVLGGVTEFMKVAALAQANDLDIAPHGAQEVHIHLVCAIPNGLILEYYRDSVDPMHGKIYKNTIQIKDGNVFAPNLPGLGLELDRDVLAEYRVA